jgi:Aconitase family (aconitate hydratase)
MSPDATPHQEHTRVIFCKPPPTYRRYIEPDPNYAPSTSVDQKKRNRVAKATPRPRLYAIHSKTTKLKGSTIGKAIMSLNSFNSRSTLKVGDKEYEIYRLDALDQLGISTKHLPYCLRILLENLLRTEDGRNVKKEDVRSMAAWNKNSQPDKEIAFTPSRVLLQDFTGVPCVVDLAAMRDAMKALGGDPALINPLQPVELVIDHSVQVDEFGTANAFDINALLEFQRNKERYSFLRWGQTGFRNLAIVPPDTGIVTR